MDKFLVSISPVMFCMLTNFLKAALTYELPTVSRMIFLFFQFKDFESTEINGMTDSQSRSHLKKPLSLAVPYPLIRSGNSRGRRLPSMAVFPGIISEFGLTS